MENTISNLNVDFVYDNVSTKLVSIGLFVLKILLRAEPLFVLTAMNASQHRTDQVLLGVFSFVKGGGDKRKWTSLGCLFFLSQIKGDNETRNDV